MKIRRILPFQRLFPANVSGMRAWPALIIALCAGCAHTSKLPGQPVAAQVQELRTHLTKAVLYIGPTGWSFNVAQKEEDLPTISCEYILTTPDTLSTLMDILDRARFVQDKPPTMLNARIGVYLHQDNGAISKLILSNAFRGEGARGVYDNGTDVVSSLEFPKELRAFAMTLQQTKPNWYCDGEKKAAAARETAPGNQPQ